MSKRKKSVNNQIMQNQTNEKKVGKENVESKLKKIQLKTIKWEKIGRQLIVWLTQNGYAAGYRWTVEWSRKWSLYPPLMWEVVLKRMQR